MTVIRQNENILKRTEATQRFVRFAPSATSYGLGWKALQAVRYRHSPASGEYSLPQASRHGLVLTIRPAERLEVRYEGVKLDRPPVAGSINLIPAGSSVLWRRQGSIDALFIHLEPSLVARVAAESFGLQKEAGHWDYSKQPRNKHGKVNITWTLYYSQQSDTSSLLLSIRASRVLLARYLKSTGHTSTVDEHPYP